MARRRSECSHSSNSKSYRLRNREGSGHGGADVRFRRDITAVVLHDRQSHVQQHRQPAVGRTEPRLHPRRPTDRCCRRVRVQAPRYTEQRKETRWRHGPTVFRSGSVYDVQQQDNLIFSMSILLSCNNILNLLSLVSFLLLSVIQNKG